MVSYKISPPAEKPDVYYIILDCYPSGNFLRDKMQFDNSAFDSTLRTYGFKVISSKSNYNKTAFSIPSVMNFDYLQIDASKAISAIDYTNALHTTKASVVPKIF